MSALVLFIATIFVVILGVLPTDAYWIITHHPLVYERLDPILNPGGISGHTHAFVGSAALLPTANPNSSCTTSTVKADKSNYWQPALYYFNATNGTFSSVPLGFVNTYYLQRGGSTAESQNTSNIGILPQGLRMLAGSATLYDAPNNNSQAAAAINFVCLDYTSGTTFSSTIPEGPCPDGLRAQVVFPSCWNGIDLDSADHQSHMSYPLGTSPDNGDCPTTHPYKLITLFYEFVWSTGSLFSSADGTLVLANGDTVGYSLHADFISGWNETVLRSAIDQCDGQLGGDLSGCPPFVPSLQDEVSGTIDYCTTTQAVEEVVTGSDLQYLPGCQPIRNGQWEGVGLDCVPATPNITTPQTINTTSAIVVPSGFTDLGCYVEGSSRILSSASYSRNTNSASNCTAFCSAGGYRYAGVEYGSECYCGNFILNGGAGPLTNDSTCDMLCSGDSVTTCGGSDRLQIYQNQTWSPSLNTVQSYQEWHFTDCAVDTLTPRTLSQGISVGSSMTVEGCLDACAAQGMVQCGLEYSSQCYGSISLVNYTSAPSLGSTDPQARGCNMPCAGNTSEVCGGAAKLNLYTLTNASSTVVIAAQAASSTSLSASLSTSTSSLPASSSSISSPTSSRTSSTIASSSSLPSSSSMSLSTSPPTSASSTASPATSTTASTTTAATTTVLAVSTSTTTATVTSTIVLSSTTTRSTTTTVTTSVNAKRSQPTTTARSVSALVSSKSSLTPETKTKYTSTSVVTRTLTVFLTQHPVATRTHTSTSTVSVKKTKKRRQDGSF